MFDAIVIGAGSGGRAVAGGLADEGMNVAMVEKELVGGECPFWACMPAKALLRVTDAVAGARRVPGVTATIDSIEEAIGFREDIVSGRDDTSKVLRYRARGVTILRGRASLGAAGGVDINGDHHETKRIVIATGSVPVIPPIDGLERIDYWTNRGVMEMRTPPTSALLVGGGPVGLEVAQTLARLGTEVSVVEPDERLLAGEEPEVGELVAECFRSDGIKLLLGTQVTRVEPRDGLTRVVMESGDERLVERVIVATGRRPDLDDLLLDNAGITPHETGIPVDEHCRAAEGVWAVGDVTGIGQFTHLAAYQSRIVCADILGHPVSADYRAVPRSVYCDPEVAAVGMTLAQAREAGIDAAIGHADLGQMERAATYGDGVVGRVGVIADRRRGVLVGAYGVGPLASEWMGMAVLAIRADVPLTVLRELILQFPTFSEGLVTAVRGLDLPEPTHAG